jgi:hypothetical protein
LAKRAGELIATVSSPRHPEAGEEDEDEDEDAEREPAVIREPEQDE